MKTYFSWSLIIMLCISAIVMSSYGQTNRFVSVEMYNSNLVKYLLPEFKGSDTIEIISFIERPSFNPESAFRIIRSHDQFTLEGRFCKKNYWVTIFPYFGKNVAVSLPEISFTRLNISNEFADKLIAVFREAVDNKEKRYYEPSSDMVSYVLRYKSQVEIFSKTIDEPRKGDPCYNLCMTSSELAKDIKNQAIDEAKYLNLIKKDDIGSVYYSNLKKYLFPAFKGSDTTEIITFVEMPAFSGESVFRIVRSHNKYSIEGRFCKKNYWYEIYPYLKKGEAIPAPETSFYSFDISNEFADKFISAFHEEVNRPKKPKSENYKMENGKVALMLKTSADGVTYILGDLSSEKLSSKAISNPLKEDLWYNLCVTSSSLLKDLKNQSFGESKYIDMKLP